MLPEALLDRWSPLYLIDTNFDPVHPRYDEKQLSFQFADGCFLRYVEVDVEVEVGVDHYC